ncbi:uncharacterized protein C8Q71DRAFT_425626 [Rhodofomes roseus]|uniref:PPM-type phosphatase domain-containing protein n=1 Tax=Rhodofomes roseus TaxID=34475 RepID=A0ABQ8KSN0_9APHY|nr:uncharacterized protein C8Q71DRAFT_425626 [Rhodofomes roseus]KAH9840836.1 hypothetical protein C8Q71DRAFT_425626 [Rhodofomes roseus]
MIVTDARLPCLPHDASLTLDCTTRTVLGIADGVIANSLGSPRRFALEHMNDSYRRASDPVSVWKSAFSQADELTDSRSESGPGPTSWVSYHCVLTGVRWLPQIRGSVVLAPPLHLAPDRSNSTSFIGHFLGGSIVFLARNSMARSENAETRVKTQCISPCLWFAPIAVLFKDIPRSCWACPPEFSNDHAPLIFSNLVSQRIPLSWISPTNMACTRFPPAAGENIHCCRRRRIRVFRQAPPCGGLGNCAVGRWTFAPSSSSLLHTCVAL